jgi:selenocysteine lyase/cysteine desulfurase
MTGLFEASYDTIAAFLNAPSRRNIILCRNTTEAINAVMYSLLTTFRDGDNLVATLLEHNSNYVPWYALCRELLPKFGVRVECRLARFDPTTGALHGPVEAAERAPLVAFNIAGCDPVQVANQLNNAGVEARAGCHCATLAHRFLEFRSARQLPTQLRGIQHQRRRCSGDRCRPRDRRSPTTRRADLRLRSYALRGITVNRHGRGNRSTCGW